MQQQGHTLLMPPGASQTEGSPSLWASDVHIQQGWQEDLQWATVSVISLNGNHTPTESLCFLKWCWITTKSATRQRESNPGCERHKAKCTHAITLSNSPPDGADWAGPDSLNPSGCLFLMSPIAETEHLITRYPFQIVTCTYGEPQPQSLCSVCSNL